MVSVGDGPLPQIGASGNEEPDASGGGRERANVGAFHMVVKQTLQTVFFSGIQQTENKKGKYINAVLISVSGTLLAALIPRKRRGN